MMTCLGCLEDEKNEPCLHWGLCEKCSYEDSCPCCGEHYCELHRVYKNVCCGGVRCTDGEDDGYCDVCGKGPLCEKHLRWISINDIRKEWGDKECQTVYVCTRCLFNGPLFYLLKLDKKCIGHDEVADVYHSSNGT